MDFSKITKAAGLLLIGLGLTAADTVAPMITDAVTETNSLNNVDASTLPPGAIHPRREPTPSHVVINEPAPGAGTEERSFPRGMSGTAIQGANSASLNGAIVDAMPTPVNGQVTDAATQPTMVNGAVIDAVNTPVNNQITDAAVTNMQTPGVYVNETERNTTPNPQVRDIVATSGRVMEPRGNGGHRPAERQSHTHTGSKY